MYSCIMTPLGILLEVVQAKDQLTFNQLENRIFSMRGLVLKLPFELHPVQDLHYDILQACWKSGSHSCVQE
jgi:hypothetical protein